ncbi:MAG: phosphoglucomutase/phosphomannomutase family protein, partial [Spirulinaceae cyanobacterium]
MGFAVAPIKFGTDGWRGVIGADFTFERVVLLAPWAAKVLEANYGQPETKSLVIVGYDRRFMAEDFAQAAAEAIQGVGFDVLLSQSYAPTPAFSWAAKAHNAVGAIVLTASHNPARYLGLKVKGAFGGSVAPEITQQIEAMIPQGPIAPTTPGTLELFDPWESYCQGLQPQVDVAKIREAIASGKARVFADAMHGAAATGLERLLGIKIEELNSDRDPLFNGGAPEPLEKNVGEFLATMQQAAQENPEQLRMGLVFDGDCDRIAAADGQGNFLSSQILIPILIEHLAQRHGKTGEVVKTVSGSDLIPKVADLYGLSIHQTPIGYKYIGDRMLKTKVLLGGEESGGIGYGH